MAETQIIEEGDIFFLFRPKVEEEEVAELADIQRFYMVLCPLGKKKYRLLLLGRKQLPEIRPGQPPQRRNWALIRTVVSKPDDIKKELEAAEYETKTRGKRFLPPAVPVGEGRYAIVRHKNHTELAYVLELPKKLGEAQQELELKEEASYVISVKNPKLKVPGFPQEEPAFPKDLQEMFKERRWIDVDTSSLLDYENVQLLFIGAREENVLEELGISLETQEETLQSAEFFKKLRLSRERTPVNPLVKGEFPAAEEMEVPTQKKEVGFGKGGRKGGKTAATKAASAAAVAKALGGIDFPKKKKELVEYARRHKKEKKIVDGVIDVLEELPEGDYTSMADVERGLGEVR